ncbi:MAG: hypothetical protein K5787_07115 [Lentisphaeria bacterium]|nr:hypothetical protein [Lentisphaeria bacterium]
MAIHFNPTMNLFVNWANQDGIGKTDLVHATKTQGTTGDGKVVLSANKNDGIGFAAWRRCRADIKNMNNATRDLFMQAVMDLFDAKTINDVPKSVRDKMKLTDYDGNGHPLSAHRIRSVAEAAKNALAYSAFSVSGSGEAATMLKSTFNAKMATLQGSKIEKAFALKNEMDQIAKDRFNLFFADDMKTLQKGGTSQFDLDNVRMPVAPTFKIGNETLTFDMNTPLNEKNDIIAKFVRQDRNAKFSDLKDDELNKAYAVMSILAQRFGIAMMDGVTKSLSVGPTMLTSIKINQSKRTASKCPMTLSFGDDGSLRIHYVSIHDEPKITQDGENFTKAFGMFDKGTLVTVTADVAIDAEELKKIAKTDYTQFDPAVPDAKLQKQLGEDADAAATLGQLRFGDGFQASVSCTAVLNGGVLLIDNKY